MSRRFILLAQTVEDRFIERFPQSFPIQRKLRGRRAYVRWIEDIPILLSSEGNVINFMEHIQGALLELPRLPWDGELYVHDWSQEKINGVTKRITNRHEDSLLVEYHIFDLMVDLPQEKRLKGLNAFKLEHPLVLVETPWIEKSQWLAYCQEFLSEGYEGIILRHPEGKYVSQDPAYRSPQMLKYKPSETDEYPIIDTIEGEGWAKGMLGAFVVQKDGEPPFQVGTGKALTKTARASLWRRRDSLIGRTLLVKHEPITTVGGKPICTVALEVIE